MSDSLYGELILRVLVAGLTSGAAEEFVGEANITAQAADRGEIHHGCDL